MSSRKNGRGSDALRAAAILLLVTGDLRAAGGNVSDELTVGSLGATPGAPAAPYYSNRLNGSVDVNDALSLHLDTTFTRYSRTSDSSADDIFQLLLGGTWEPSEHVAIDVDGSVSPSSTMTTLEPATPAMPASPATLAGRERVRTSAVGALITAEYDTAGDGDLESAIDVTGGVASYSTTQATRSGPLRRRVLGPSETGALVQWRAAVGVTETLFRNTDAGVVGTYYVYNSDPTDSGYYGAAVFGRGAVVDGIPLEPLRYTLRPALLERFGDLHVRASFQYGGHVGGTGYSVLGGVKVQYRVSHPLKLWVAAYHEREIDGSGVGENIDWGSLGAMLYF